MRKEPMHQAVQIIRQKRRHRVWNRAAVVVFSTTYMLIIPAITMEQTAYCGIEAHTHEEACFEKQLVCAVEEAAPHIHSESCYQEEQVLICGQNEEPGHVHDESCIQRELVPVCTEDHAHSDACYQTVESYICGQTESEGAHSHESACYETESVLACGQEENAEGHVHTEACYEAVLICPKEEHEHTLGCFSNPEADVETQAVWEKTVSDIELTGIWADDVLAVAESQLGYEESARNYVVTEDDQKKGYTRYGAWYGDPYGDWCAMFVSFCLHYAGVEGYPLDANCPNWLETLSRDPYQSYFAAENYDPQPGDLIFFNTDDKEDADHIGIVTENIEGTDAAPALVKTIEGNSSNRVQYVTYEKNDPQILGYGRLPENPNRIGLEQQFSFAVTTAEGQILTLSGPLASLPYPADEITITAEKVVSETATALVDAAVADTNLENGYVYLFDVRLWHNGEEIEPIGPVSLSISGVAATEEDQSAKVFHVDEESGQATDMNAEVQEDGEIVFDTDHFSLYSIVLPAEEGVIEITSSMSAKWDPSSHSLVSLVFTATNNDVGNVYYGVQYSDNGGETWMTAAESDKTGKKQTATLNATTALADAPLDRIFRVYATDKNTNPDKVKTGVTRAVTLYGVFDSVKSGFTDWLTESYVQDFGGTTPATVGELYQAFDLFYSLPELNLEIRAEGTQMYVDAVTDAVGTFTFEWQYLDEEGNWHSLCDDTGASIHASEIELLQDGGKQVRCKMYESNVLRAVSARKMINPKRLEYEVAIQKINRSLGLGDLEIGGHVFNDLFYYGNVAADNRVPFNNASEYADYLAGLYLSDGLDAVRAAWDYYLYDLYDPHYQSLGNQKGNYPNETVGDGGLGWPKDSDSSFHGNLTPEVKPLTYDFLEDGVDYNNFISNLTKTATADAPGDENTEREYSIDLLADAQAKADGPVAMVLQIQTSWQMFDMLHANALKGEGATAVGSVSYNTELANLYAIKHALLRFVDYMEENHLGGNLVLGITEVQHAGSSSMLNGQDGSGKALCVSNDYDVLRQAIINWDSFGNCEHVHYDTDALKTATANLESNLAGWKDMYGTPIQYADIRKVAVIIGGPTENSNGKDGYGCTLPWSTFQSAKLNSVYSIRTNNGTSNGSGLISWLDNAANNTGSAFHDGTGTTFTDKYVATTEEAVFQYLVRIAETEMMSKGLDITAADKYVENVTVTDTIVDELFLLDTEEEIVATIYNADGSIDTTIADNPKVLSLDDPNLTIAPGEQPGTTKITYNFGTVYNTKKCGLHFSVKANEDYIGSNNVYSNLGTPEVTYQHTVLDREGNSTGIVKDYSVDCYNTPQVNVPIRFNTTDGDEVTILVGDKVNLADLSPAIVEHAESLIDNYDQINGTLSYTWVLPDGTEVPAGSVTVVNGSIGAQSLPSREYEFTGKAPGRYECTLKVTFTPEPVDTTSKNFSDEQTAVPVGSLTKEGNVWINVYAGDSTERFLVRKVWLGSPPSGTDTLTFRVLAGGEPVQDDSGSDRLYTLDAANGWETEVSGLPSVVDGVIQSYSVEGYPVPDGYVATYSSTTQQEDDYAGKLILTFTPSSNQDNKTLKIICSYNGQEYTYVTPRDSYKSNRSYSFTVDNLPLDENGEPYAGQLVSIVKVGDGKTVELSASSVSSEKYLRGTSVLQVKVITNAVAYELPKTGGPGITQFTLSGLCLVAGTLVYIYSARRRRERGIRN